MWIQLFAHWQMFVVVFCQGWETAVSGEIRGAGVSPQLEVAGAAQCLRAAESDGVCVRRVCGGAAASERVTVRR